MEEIISAKMPFVYVLTDETCTRCYTGFAKHSVKHRLRQHNGEISGGAKSTKRFKGKAKVAFYIGSFRDDKAGLQFEWALKRTKGKVGGCVHRAQALQTLLKKEKWTSKALPSRKHQQMTIYWSEIFRRAYPELVEEMKAKISETSLTPIRHENFSCL
jgi:hypothetical protein